jgi:hypothetical protein
MSRNNDDPTTPFVGNVQHSTFSFQLSTFNLPFRQDRSDTLDISPVSTVE